MLFYDWFATWIPEHITAAMVSVLFALFGIHALRGLFAPLSSRCNALAGYPPVVCIDFINDDNRRLRILTQYIDQQLGGTHYELFLLLGSYTFPRDSYIHIRHNLILLA